MNEGIAVLYVDDEPDLLEIARAFLEDSGDFRVTTETSAKHALDSPGLRSFDVILSDYLMPEMDGIAFLKEVRQRFGSIPFILFTGRGREEVVIEAINNGADFYLQKGGDPTAQFAELAHKIRQAVARRHAELERGKAEQGLRESENNYQNILERLQDAYFRTNENGIITMVNPAAVRMYRYGSAGEMTGLPATAFYTGGESERNEMLRQLRGERSVVNFLGRGLRKDGTTFATSLNVQVIHDGEGRIRGTEATVRDISEQQKAQDELRAAYEQITASEEELRSNLDEIVRAQADHEKSEKNFRYVVENAPDAIFTEVDDRFLYLNKAAVRLFGAESAGQVTGTSVWDRIHPLFHDRIRDRLVNLVADEKPVGQLDEVYVRLDGTTVDVEATAMPYLHEGRKGALVMLRDITDRKKAEEALFSSRQMLQAVLDTIPQRVFWKDRNSVFLGCNLPLARDVGFSDPAEITGRTDYDHSSRALAERFRADDRRVMESGEPRINYDESQIRPDGSTAWLRTSKIPLRSRDGEIIGVLGTYEDITEQKRAEGELRESEERSRRILDQAPIPLGYVRDNGTIPFINERFTRLFGYTREDIPTIDAWWRQAFPDPEYRNRVIGSWEEEIRRAREEQSDIVPGEFRIACRDGNERIVEISGITLSDGFLAIFIDQTDRKKAEAALRESEERYSAIVNNTPGPVLTVRDGKILFINEAGIAASGYPREELIGRPILGFLTSESQKTTLGAMQRRQKNQERVSEYEVTFIRKDGRSVQLIVRAIDIVYRGGQITLALLLDITDRKRADEALRMANKKLSLLSGITRHDISNQLQALTMTIELAGKAVTDPVRSQDLNRKAAEIIGTLTELITFSRDYEEIGMHAPAWQNVHALTGTIVPQLPVRTIRIEPCDPSLEIYADPLLVRVFYNLIDNALRYGGESLTTIRITSHGKGGELVVVVEDDGCGIAAGDRERIFARGFGRHTGLGLFLSREILSITGITIAETGRPGTGARFEITVPQGAWRRSGGGAPEHRPSGK